MINSNDKFYFLVLLTRKVVLLEPHSENWKSDSVILRYWQQDLKDLLRPNKS